jgi:kinesin family protein 2/24
VDIDFEIMIGKCRYGLSKIKEHTSPAELKLSVNVRKRPIFKKE